MKNLLSVDEQIEHMKQKGITFNYISEEDAKVFLSQNNYYMKLAAYVLLEHSHQQTHGIGILPHLPEVCPQPLHL